MFEGIRLWILNGLGHSAGSFGELFLKVVLKKSRNIADNQVGINTLISNFQTQNLFDSTFVQ